MKAIPWAEGVMFIRPFRGDGETAGGILVEHSVRLPPIYGRVVAVHPSCTVRVGEFVVYRAHKPIRIDWTEGTVFALLEHNVVAIVTPDNGEPFFRGRIAA